MLKMTRNHGNLKKGQEIELSGKQKEIFLANGFAEEVKDELPCNGCEDKKPCSECEEHAKSKRVASIESIEVIEAPKEKATPKPRTPKAPKK